MNYEKNNFGWIKRKRVQQLQVKSEKCISVEASIRLKRERKKNNSNAVVAYFPLHTYVV